MKKLLIIAIALMTGIAMAAPDGDKPGDGKGKGGKGGGKGGMLKKLDTDGDGAISKAEWNAGPFAKKNPEKAAKGFERMDADGDGKITGAEMKKAAEARKGKGKGKGDKGGKGKGKGDKGGKGKGKGEGKKEA